jgi:hypothetical protein
MFHVKHVLPARAETSAEVSMFHVKQHRRLDPASVGPYIA